MSHAPSTSRSSASPCLGLLLALVLAVTLTACGSRSPRQRFAARLNAMCKDFAAREKRIGEPTSTADVAVRGNRIATAFDEAIARPIEALQAPPELASQAALLRTITRRQSAVLHALPVAARSSGRAELLRLIERNRRLNAQSDAIARRLEARSCTG